MQGKSDQITFGASINVEKENVSCRYNQMSGAAQQVNYENLMDLTEDNKDMVPYLNQEMNIKIR